jgi:hypothetical protein
MCHLGLKFLHTLRLVNRSVLCCASLVTVLSTTGCGSAGEADASGSRSAALMQRHGDRRPPSIPEALSAVAISATEIYLAWSPSTDNVGVTGYVISRDGAPLANQGEVTEYKDATVSGSTQYTFTVAAIDRAGNISGQSQAAVVITPASDTPPTVSVTIPQSAAVGVALNSSISAIFSETMSDSTLNSASFAVTTNTGVAVTGSVTVTDNTATFVPSVNFDANTQYTATISTAATDPTGNALADNYSWSFTTAAATEVATAILSWDPVTATNLSGYRLYYGTAPGTYLQPLGEGISVGNVVTYSVTGLNSGTRYYFVATSVDTSGRESVYSNEVFKDVP